MSAATKVVGIAGAMSLAGRDLGTSDWHEVTQEQVDLFAEATGDRQWIHVDPVRAKDGPFGGPIAHGYMTLSLTPHFLPQLLEFEGFALGVNYGCERVRFPAPVPVGSKLRASAFVDDVSEIPGGVQVRMTLTFQVDGQSKPSCVATIVIRQYV